MVGGMMYHRSKWPQLIHSLHIPVPRNNSMIEGARAANTRLMMPTSSSAYECMLAGLTKLTAWR
jgi:hypothetical protein